LISTVITLVILLAVVIVPRVTGLGEDSLSPVGLAGAQASELRAALEAQGGAADAIRIVDFASASAAEQAVRDGSVDAAIVGDSRIVVKEELSDDLQVRLQGASGAVRAQAALAAEGVNPEQTQAILAPAPLPVESLEPKQEGDGNEGFAFVAVVLLYSQIFGYGFWVGAGVVEEKASRVVELILATISPRQLLAGKILGIGLLGFVQLLALGAVAFITAVAIDAIDAGGSELATIGIVLGFFVLGYAFYASLFAAAGSSVQRVEDLQNTTTPLILVVVASLVISIVAVNDPEGTLAQVFSLVPPFSAIVMPPRVAAGDAAGWEIAVAVLLLLGAIALLVPIAARIYSNAVLRTRGRISLRDAYRGTPG
jgi:ABC-2 type transport system permease protein